MDLLNLKKMGQGVRSWIRIDKEGATQVMEVDKLTIMRRCDLPARDLRLLDPLFVYPSTILGREKAIVVNLEQIRCIITADEVLLLNSLDNYVLQYIAELQKRLALKNDFVKRPFFEVLADSLSCSERKETNTVSNRILSSDGPRDEMVGGSQSSRGSFAEYMPFEFLALEVALEAACTFLDTQVCLL
jgi:magnesium transporter